MDAIFKYFGNLPTDIITIACVIAIIIVVILFKNFLLDMRKIGFSILNRMDLIEINQDSGDFALYKFIDKHFPHNGETFLDIKRKHKEDLLKDWARKKNNSPITVVDTPEKEQEDLSRKD